MNICHRGPAGQRLDGPGHQGTHDDCTECGGTHCIVCGKTHLTEPTMRTCPQCVGNTRDDLAAIPELYIRLKLHSIYGGNNGKLEAGRPIPGGDAQVIL
ncbi:MAG: hypothetical protein M3440_10870, partial [Chloroflexota bacterium]|nr:hypothetical protein [Chloroflexota bacterium]